MNINEMLWILMWLDAGVYVMNGVGSVSFDVAGCRGVGMNTIEMLLILM